MAILTGASYMEVTIGTLNRLKALLINSVSLVYYKIIRQPMLHWFIRNYDRSLGTIIIMI